MDRLQRARKTKQTGGRERSCCEGLVFVVTRLQVLLVSWGCGCAMALPLPEIAVERDRARVQADVFTHRPAAPRRRPAPEAGTGDHLQPAQTSAVQTLSASYRAYGARSERSSSGRMNFRGNLIEALIHRAQVEIPRVSRNSRGSWKSCPG